MEKRNIQPQQHKPVVRLAAGQPAIAGQSRQQLTAADGEWWGDDTFSYTISAAGCEWMYPLGDDAE